MRITSPMWMKLFSEVPVGIIRFFLPAVILFWSSGSMGIGVLSFRETRVILDEKTQESSLIYTNPGEDSVEYILFLRHMEMNAHGTLDELPDGINYPWFADKYIRISRTHIKIAPGETQALNITATLAPDMKPGEYRTHLYFRSVPHKKGPSDDQNQIQPVEPMIGISVPVILRIGDYHVAVCIDSLQFSWVNDTLPILSYSFIRSGTHSVYGNIKATYLSPLGRKVVLGVERNVAIYTPGNVRSSQMILIRKKGINYSAGQILLEYTTSKGEDQVLIASRIIDLQSGLIIDNTVLSLNN